MRKFVVCCLMILPLVVVGCSKGPAEAALKAADEAIAKVKPEAEKFVPEQFKALTETAAAAKANFDKGDYAAALNSAKDLPAKATEVATAAAAKKDELVAKWNEMSKNIPAAILGLNDNLKALTAMKKLPPGVDAAKIENVKGQMDAINTAWTKAGEAFTAGDITGAIDLGSKVQNDAGVLTTAFDAIMPKPVAKK